MDGPSSPGAAAPGSGSVPGQSGGDLASKYQRLATEYVKLKAQIPVLKGAVLEEQAKEAVLKEALREKDRSMRTSEQEVDSLTFRNKQLSTRVSILQTELNEIKSRGKKSKTKGNDVAAPAELVSGGQASGIYGEELQSKIEENARLHKQVHDAEGEHEAKVLQLESQLAQAEAEANRYKQQLENISDANKTAHSKLLEDKAALELKMENQTKVTSHARARAEVGEHQLKELQQKLGGELAEATKMLHAKVPFNDLKIRQLSVMNVPTYHRDCVLAARESVSEALLLVRATFLPLSNFYTHFQQANATNIKLSDLLHSHSQYLHPLELYFQEFCESVTSSNIALVLENNAELQQFSQRFAQFADYSTEVTPYMLTSMEEENAAVNFPEPLKQQNKKIHSTLASVNDFWSSIRSCLAVITEQSKLANRAKTKKQAFDDLCQTLQDLHEAFRALSQQYMEKFTTHQQQSAYSQQAKPANHDSILSALIELVVATEKLSKFTGRQKPAFYETIDQPWKTADSESLPMLQKMAADYFASLYQNEPAESVPYEEAVKNKQILAEWSDNRSSLQQQLSACQTKMRKLEQEKEHWLLEAQLVQIKYEKEAKKSANSSPAVSATGEGAAAKETAGRKRLSKSFSSQPQYSAAVAGTVDRMEADDDEESEYDGEEMGESRESLIKSHFSSRISKLSHQLQMADSKLMNFAEECAAVHKRLEQNKVHKVKSSKELSDAYDKINLLQDELDTTSKNYEEQLNMMSEHLAGMNDKLTRQQDEIQALKMKLEMKDSKKKRGK